MKKIYSLTFKVSEKRTKTQKLDKTLQSQGTIKSRTRLSTDGSFQLYSLRCMHIVFDKMSKTKKTL